jgi:hypothetical protein
VVNIEISRIYNLTEYTNEEQFNTHIERANHEKGKYLHDREVGKINYHTYLSEESMSSSPTIDHAPRVIDNSKGCKKCTIHPSSSLLY